MIMIIINKNNNNNNNNNIAFLERLKVGGANDIIWVEPAHAAAIHVTVVVHWIIWSRPQSMNFNVSSNYICGVHEFIVYTIRYDIFTCAQKLNDMAS